MNLAFVLLPRLWIQRSWKRFLLTPSKQSALLPSTVILHLSIYHKKNLSMIIYLKRQRIKSLTTTFIFHIFHPNFFNKQESHIYILFWSVLSVLFLFSDLFWSDGRVPTIFYRGGFQHDIEWARFSITIARPWASLVRHS